MTEAAVLEMRGITNIMVRLEMVTKHHVRNAGS